MNVEHPPATLYGVGVGPGAPELLTLKAVRVIREAQVIAVPVAKPGEDSFALSVAREHLRAGQEVLRLHFPMTSDAAERTACVQSARRQVLALLAEGLDVAFLTEGDPLMHSTFIYLLEELPVGVRVEIVPGVSSIMASAAGARFPLARAEERLAVLPAAFLQPDDLRWALDTNHTVVLLKVYRVLDGLIDLLEEMDLLEGAVLVAHASLADQTIEWDVRALRGKRVPYFSTLLVRGRAGGGR